MVDAALLVAVDVAEHWFFAAVVGAEALARWNPLVQQTDAHASRSIREISRFIFCRSDS